MDLIIVFFGVIVVIALRVLESARAGWRLMATIGMLLVLMIFSWVVFLFNADRSAALVPPASRQFANVAIGFGIACVTFLVSTIACLVYAWRRRPTATQPAR
jgi:hypothetical protein